MKGALHDITAADGHTLQVYEALPPTDVEVVGGVVIIQEIFGLNGHIRDVCDRYAALGYHAVAPALFDRVARNVALDYDAEGVAKGRALRGELGWDVVFTDVKTAKAVLPAHLKHGIVGYCFGGSVAFAAAARLDDFAAAVAYYGGQVSEFVGESLNCPVMLHFGEKDDHIPLSVAQNVKEAYPNQAEVYTYPDADHGFNCDRRASYHEQSAKLALERTLAFLGKHLAAT